MGLSLTLTELLQRPLGQQLMKSAGEVPPLIPPQNPPGIGNLLHPGHQRRPPHLLEAPGSRVPLHLQKQSMKIGLHHHQPPMGRQLLEGLLQRPVLLSDQPVERMALRFPKAGKVDGAATPGQFMGHQEPAQALIAEEPDSLQQVGVHGLPHRRARGRVEIVVRSGAEHYQGAGGRPPSPHGRPIAGKLLHLGEQVGRALRREARAGAGAPKGVVGAARQGGHQGRKAQARRQGLHPEGAVAAPIGPVGGAGKGPVAQESPGVAPITEAVAEDEQSSHHGNVRQAMTHRYHFPQPGRLRVPPFQRIPVGWSRMLGALAGLATLSLLTACQGGAEGPTRPPLAVQVEETRVTRFTDAVDTVSTLEAVEEVALAAQANGRIQQLLVRQGDPVRQGQLLMMLDQTQAQAEVARLKAETETKRLNFQRYETLVKQGAASAIQRDQYRQDYISSRMEWVARSADLGFRALRAPISGTVGDVQVKVGDVIAAGAPFTRIIRNDPLEARVDVPAIYADRLRVGLPVILMDPATGRPIAQSAVSSLDPGVVAGTQSVLAKAEFGNPTGTLRNGLRTRTRLILSERAQLSVPFEAVTQISGQRFVFGVGDLADLERRPGQAKLERLRKLPPGTLFALQTPVELGSLQNNRYPVLRGVEPGQKVITSNLASLRHGLPVKVN